MEQEIIRIALPMPLRMGSVNCYLVRTGDGFFMVDTGLPKNREILEEELRKAGCVPGKLKLVIITHGDFDHTGNAAWLKRKYGAKIAMHEDDSGMAEYGNMFYHRKKFNFLVRMLAPVLFGFSRSNRFTPDINPEDGYDFSGFGFDAEALYIPGHSKGSTGVLTAEGDLFCGDLMENNQGPRTGSITDDPETAEESIRRLAGLKIRTVYPGHGRPFPMEEFKKSLR